MWFEMRAFKVRFGCYDEKNESLIHVAWVVIISMNINENGEIKTPPHQTWKSHEA